jgi:hypothetical protein
MILRVYWQLQGENVRLQVHTAIINGSFKPAGNLLMSAAEFLELSRGNIQTEFLEVVERPK